MTAKLKSVKAELMRKRHLPVPEQGRWLASVIAGHEAYYAVPGNAKAVGAFRHRVIRHWRHALGRRSQKGRVNWERMLRLSTATCLRPGSGIHGLTSGSPPGTHDRSPVR